MAYGRQLFLSIGKRHVIAGLVVIIAVLFFLLPQQSDLKMSVVSVCRMEDGAWYATMLLTNKLDVQLGFEWMDSEDRELGVKSTERMLAYDYTLTPSTIGPHEGTTYRFRLPPPGTARRFRLRYHPLSEEENRLKRMIRHLYSRDDWKPAGHVVISPEVSAGDTVRH